MKNIILINLFLIFLFKISPTFAGLPNVPKGIDADTYCDNAEARCGA